MVMNVLIRAMLLLLVFAGINAKTTIMPSVQPLIQIDTIGEAFIRLPVPNSCISEPDDSFQVMHTFPLFIPVGYMNNPSMWIVGTPLVDGSSLCEDPCIYVMDDSLNFTENLYDLNAWHELIDTSGAVINNPLCSASFFDDPEGYSYSWAASAYGAYMSDPVLLLDKDNSPVMITRITRNVEYASGLDRSSLSIHSIYAHKFNGSNWDDTTLLIDGYVNNGSDIYPEHGSMLLMAPSIFIDNDKYIMVVNEDTSANRTALAVWEGSSLDSAFHPINTFSRTILEGNGLNDNHFSIGILNWTLPGNNYHRHTQITKLKDSLYIGFATPMLDKDTCWFGYSYDFENWYNPDKPLLTGSGWLDQWIYTVHPLIEEKAIYLQLHLLVSGRGKNINQGDSIGWYTSNVDMKIIKDEAQLLPGDVNLDYEINVADLVYMVNYIFKGGISIFPEYIGDVDHTCDINVADLVYMVNYLFKGGPDPLVGCE